MTLSVRARLLERAIPKVMPTADQSPAEQRAKIDRTMGLPNRKVDVTDLQVGGVPCVRVQPKGAPRRRHLVHLHGGGFVVGTPRSFLGYVADLALRADAVVTSVDYRLAPEHPYPAPIDDAVAAYRAVAAETDPESLCLIGESAGGNAVAATLVRARDEGMTMPACAVLLSPWLDMTFSGESVRRNKGRDVMLEERLITSWRDAYVGEAEPSDPGLSPLFADLSSLPPMHVQCTTAEVIEDDARRFVDAVRAAGGEAELVVHDDLWHVFQTMVPLVPEASAALEQVNEFIRRHTRG